MQSHFKILIYQPKQLGDILLCTPLLREIKKTLPQSEVHFLTSKIGKQVLKNNPYIDYLHISNKVDPISLKLKLLKNLRKTKFNIVFDMMSTSKSVLFLSLLKSKSIFASRKRFQGLLSTKVIDESKNPYQYSVYSKLLYFNEWLYFIGKSSSAKTDLLDYSQDLEIFLDDSEKNHIQKFISKYEISSQNTIALNVVSRRDYKIWSPEKFVKIVIFLLDRKYKILFLYGPGEKELVSKVLQLLPKNYLNDKNLLVDYDFLDVRNLFGVLQSCRMYIGNDGGPKHLACAAQLPTVTIFQNLNPKNWTPVNNNAHKAFVAETSSVADVIYYLEQKL